MASSLALFLSSFLLLIFASHARNSFRPHALVLPVRKDASTLQYVTRINQRTPQVSVELALHLGGNYLLVDCDNNYVSSTYRPVYCRTAQCSLARYTSCGDCVNGPRPGCNNNTCVVLPNNPFLPLGTSGELAQDIVTVQSTDGSTPGRSVTVPRFIFTCAPTFLFQGLASGATGLAGLGRARIGVPSLFSSAFSFRRRFAICLSSSTSANGVIFFGDGPYNLLQNVEVSKSLRYTKLITNPVSTAGSYLMGEPSTEYFIRVNTIRVNNNPLLIYEKLLRETSVE